MNLDQKKNEKKLKKNHLKICQVSKNTYQKNLQKLMNSPEITKFQKEIENLTQTVSSLSLENASSKQKIKELQETSMPNVLKLMKMNEKIWRVLAQILSYRNDLSEIIKPFFKNLHNENINDEKFIPIIECFIFLI